jgi:hypothetical protein
MYKFEAPKDGYMEITDWRIQLWSRSEGPWATLTLNDPEANPKEWIFVIKSYSENFGVFEWMRDNGFIRNVIDIMPCGNGCIVLCKLDVNKIKNYGE